MTSPGVQLMQNIFTDIPERLEEEIFSDLLQGNGIRIERIVSQGQSSPEQGWYDQAENEWVIVLKGAARISFSDGREKQLQAGDYLNIPAHQQHRVAWTDPHCQTVWLAVFYP